MGIKSLSNSSGIVNFQKHQSMLAGIELNKFHHLETVRLGSSAASVEFTNLGEYSDYQHLQIRMSLRSTRSALADSADITFNGTSSPYKWHALRGSGSSVESYSGGDSYMQAALIPGNTNVAGNFGAVVVDILDPFKNTKNTTQKTSWGMHGGNENFIGLFSGGWFSTDAVTSITIDCSNADFISGCRFSLYGLKVGA